MIGYVTLGTNDLERAGAFYDRIAEILGFSRIMASDRTIMWGTPGHGAMLGVLTPYDGKPATSGNGTMFGLHAGTEDKVQAIHAFALANGGSDEGAPGPRGDTFYGGYFRDPDGNKLVAYVVKSA